MRNLLLITVFASACAAQLHTAVPVPVETRKAILEHYARGESLASIADEFHLESRDDALQAVHDAMFTLAYRLHNDQ
jgi:hypothetical protein